MIDNIKRGLHVDHLVNIRNIARKMKKTLLSGNLTKFPELMNQETENRKQLDKSVLPPKAGSMIKQGFKNGAVGAKILGSGNGGSILFYGHKNSIVKCFKRKVIDFKFDFEGLKVL